MKQKELIECVENNQRTIGEILDILKEINSRLVGIEEEIEIIEDDLDNLKGEK